MTSIQAEASCHWCNQPKDTDAKRCPNCGKLRKDIYEDKMKSYAFGVLGALPFGAGIGLYLVQHIKGSSDTTSAAFKLSLTIIGGFLVTVGLRYYMRASKKMQTYWWI